MYNYFWLIPFLKNTDKQLQFFGQAQEVSIRLSENKILEIMSKTTYEFATKYKIFKYSVEDNFALFANLIKINEESHGDQRQRT